MDTGIGMGCQMRVSVQAQIVKGSHLMALRRTDQTSKIPTIIYLISQTNVRKTYDDCRKKKRGGGERGQIPKFCPLSFIVSEHAQTVNISIFFPRSTDR